MAWTVGQVVTAAELNTYVPQDWTTWSSPTISGLTKGNGTEVASYLDRDNEVLCYYRFVLGSTSAVTGDLLLTTPTTHVHGGIFAGGGSYFEDNGTSRYPVHVASIGTTQVLIRPIITSVSTPLCSVRMSAAQSVSNNSNTTLLFDTEDLDALTWHSTASNTGRITPTIAGWYEATYSTDWQSDTDYTRTMVTLQKNGGATTPARSLDVVGGAAVTTPNLSGAFPPVQLNGTTDYLEIFAFQTNTSAGANTCDAAFTVKLVYPTSQPDKLYAQSSTAASSTVPFTWTTSDEIVAMFGYRK